MTNRVKCAFAVLIGAVPFIAAYFTAGPLGPEVARCVKASGPPPCVFTTIRYPCVDAGLACGRQTNKADCEKTLQNEPRLCVSCTAVGGHTDVVLCVRTSEDAWTLVCETRVEPGGCGLQTVGSVCKWTDIDDEGVRICRYEYRFELPCHSHTLIDWNGDCIRP
jgi:hypothetical protein